MWASDVVFEPMPPSLTSEIYEALKKRGVKYSIQLPSNDNLLQPSRSYRDARWVPRLPLGWVGDPCSFEPKKRFRITTS